MIDLRNWGATASEISSEVPGDALVTGRAEVGTRTITIEADPELVFDYLAQMGFGRAGWYSYDWLDNLGRHSADTIDPRWLVRQAGERVPAGPIAFEAVVVDRPLAYALQVPRRRLVGHAIDFTLAYRLDPIPDGTRLVSRVRLAIDGPLGPLLARPALLADGVMVRRQLLGIKKRCLAERAENV